ncbi:MAG: hypothetical protein RMJ66_04885 [Bacteroidia bacterium]|nr:hypothetical protein [Bacteroidia bacterium]
MGWLALAYAAVLWGISYWVSRRQNGEELDTFYVARRRGNWLWVGYSMVGTALSGLTFISLPGSVRTDGWTYLQVVIGYFIGYLGIAYGLLPLYYRYARASVYEYFRYTLGSWGEKTATCFFLLSRGIGSSLRLFLALWILHYFFPTVPFTLLCAIVLGVILIYTIRSGIAAIIYTDFFQTTVFLASAALTAYYIWKTPLTKCFKVPTVLELSPTSPHFWLKDLLGGALIAFSMTGLDQDQMQKNLSLPTLKEAQKNLLFYATLLLPVNFLFLFLGSSLWAYLDCKDIHIIRSDEAFLRVAQIEGPLLQAFFVWGVVAAALSSADGTLAALTTVTLRNLLPPHYERTRTKNFLLLGWTIIFWLLLWGYTYLPQEGHILGIFLKFSGYTYGPLLGLFLFSRIGSKNASGLRHVPWALPLLLGVSIGVEKVAGLNWGYGTILWIALWSWVGLWIITRVFR